MSIYGSAKCYIEESSNKHGKMSAQLHEKVTGRKVFLGMTASQADSRHFLRFLNAAARNKTARPDVFTKDGSADWISVTGDIDHDGADELRFVHNDELSYTRSSEPSSR